MQTFDVVVIGAGAAGLAAARPLAESGLRVLVLEARKRTGGRIFTERLNADAFVEHGAEFVHGRPPELWHLLEEAGIATTERTGAMLDEAAPGSGVEQEEEQHDEMTDPLATLADLPGDDMAFADWLAQSDVPTEERAALTGYVEGFNAADAARISARSLGIQQRADDAVEGDRAWHVHGGYARVTDYLAERVQAAGGVIRLGCDVHAVRWRPGQVVVSTRSEDVYAPRCVITLPLGVLHAANSSLPGSVRLEPEPRALREARRLAMGNVLRFTLIFREAWWTGATAMDAEKLRTLSFLFTRERMPPVWWTRHPEQEKQPSLVGWCGGPRSLPLLNKRADELAALACDELAEAFNLRREDIASSLVSAHTHDWLGDLFAQGAYSYVPAGALDAPAAMTVPEAETLYFAGEHTDTEGFWGTVHAALRSGRRAAEQILGKT